MAKVRRSMWSVVRGLWSVVFSPIKELTVQVSDTTGADLITNAGYQK